MDAVLAPKVAGTDALLTALAHGPVTSWCSSRPPGRHFTGGGPGRVDHAAASAYLDAVARARQAVTAGGQHRLGRVAVERVGLSHWTGFGAAAGPASCGQPGRAAAASTTGGAALLERAGPCGYRSSRSARRMCPS